MHIAQKLLTALNNKESIKNSFPGIAGIIDGRIIKFGAELEKKDKFGNNIIKDDIAQKIEKFEYNFSEYLIINLSNKDKNKKRKLVISDIYDEFEYKYMAMLHKIDSRIAPNPEEEHCIWVNSKECINSLPIQAKVNEDFIPWRDTVNKVQYFVSEEQDKNKEELKITFHLTAWRCFSPTHQQKLAMEAKKELAEQEQAANKREELIEKNNKEVQKKREEKKERKMKVVQDAEREIVADEIAKENAKNGVSPE